MSFSKHLQDWANATQERIEAVHRTSVDMLAQEMVRTKANGGNLPVDTGNLEKSLLASQSGMPETSDAPSAGMDVGAFTATMDVSKPTWLGYQARYARRRNYGFKDKDRLGRAYDESGDHFVERAAAMWPQLVEDAIKDVKANSKP